ncbi:3'-5' exonuclease [Desulfotignum phosphitoxidans]|uniref:DNA polymerase III epsilon subunit n=1 Tax=Desulfotignum phosphitoxidans DSM 13687 TaxID=1286635 RepID=S0G3U7_9BACT|nr:3'-5' exonuclease [Desulfotignum phosphitoxidans]EMS78942.1 DNA polymerase III epsilon subunit [Desulfotignum phosphitoxidans DSM 13687]
MIRPKSTEKPFPVDWPSRFRILEKQAKDPAVKAFYQAGSVPGDTPLKQVSFLALDLETTGLDPQTDAIISVGFIPLYHDRILCSGARHWVVRPDQHRPDIQTVIHGITHSRMDACPRFNTILPRLLKAMAGRVIVAHYSRIEQGFLRKAIADLTGDDLEFPIVDTMEIESRKHPVFRPNLFQRWMGEKNSPSLRLAHARERYNLPPYRPHHALTDALAAAELFLAQTNDPFTVDTPISVLLYPSSVKT